MPIGDRCYIHLCRSSPGCTHLYMYMLIPFAYARRLSVCQAKETRLDAFSLQSEKKASSTPQSQAGFASK